MNKKGKLVKEVDSTLDALLPQQQSETSISDEDTISRMMLPMITESSLCLQENIVETPMQVDIGVLFGLGFPAFRGGVLKYADSLGMGYLIEQGKKYSHLGLCYSPTDLIKNLDSKKSCFYQN